MPAINLPNINIDLDNFKSEDAIEQILNTLQKYRKELNFLLMNLDGENMPSIISFVSDNMADDEYITTITENTIKTTNVIAKNLQVTRLVTTAGANGIIVDGSIMKMAQMMYGTDGMGYFTMGFFPQVGSIKTKSIQAMGDNNTYTTSGDSILGLGKVQNVDAVDTVSGNVIRGGNGETGGVLSLGYLTVVGTKNAVEKTDHYGDVLLHSYETPSPYYGDLGYGVIEDGNCTIAIDPILSECINTDLDYHVFTQRYNEGEISKIERFKDHFIVYGTNGLEFSWEIKGKRRNFENDRFTIFDGLRKDGTPDDTPIPDLNIADDIVDDIVDDNLDNYERVD